MSLFGSLFQLAATAVGFAVGGPAGAAVGASIGATVNASEAKKDAKQVRNIKVNEINLQRARESAKLSREIRIRRASIINRGASFGTLGASTTSALTPIFQSQFTNENNYLNSQSDLAVQSAYREASGKVSEAYQSVVNAGVQGFSIGTSLNGGGAGSLSSTKSAVSTSVNNPSNSSFF